MSDLGFSNDTPGQATEQGFLAFSEQGVSGAVNRIFEFSTVGTEAELTSDFRFQLGMDPGPVGTDRIDYFSFTPGDLLTVSINFNADSVGDFVHNLVVVPIAGVSKVTGDIVGHWFGGFHDETAGTLSQQSNYEAFAREHLSTLQSGAILGPGIDLFSTSLSYSEFAGGDAVWTLSGGDVVFAVYGVGLTGTASTVPGNDDDDFFGGLPLEDTFDPVEDNFKIDEVSYRYTILPKSGSVPDDPDGTPNPTPVAPGGPTGRTFINDLDVSEVITGTGNRDTYVAIGDSDDFTLIRSSDGSITVKDELYPDDNDTLIGIERIEFFDGTLALDTAGIAGQAYRLYQAAFARTPDNSGLTFWIDSLDDSAFDLLGAAARFVASNEFSSAYGTPSSLSNRGFVDLLYQNVLDREGEGEGFAFWRSELDTGARTREKVLLDFSESAENQANVVGVINSGIWLPGYELGAA